MDIEQVITHFGGIQRTADALDESKQCVYNWVKTKKIPLFHQCHIEHVTQGELVAHTSDLPFGLKVI